MAKSKQPEEHSASPASCKRFPIVGVGASAGGFEAIRRMLQAMPEDPPFAVVIVHHLARDKPSLAPELLAKSTRMPVREVDDGPIVQRGHVYVIPPGKFLSIDGGRLQLIKMEGPRRAPVAIDYFFRSLAKDQRECAVGIILSGTGSDGTLGVKAIKEAGGLILAQDASTAQHGGMPHSAIHTGIVDQVLAPEDIPAALARFSDHDYIRSHLAASSANDDTALVSDSESTERLPAVDNSENQAPDESSLADIIAILRTQANRDFHNYKTATLSRRTRRRMCLHHIGRYDDYLQFLSENPDEVHALAKDLLISVTDFFRDREVWDELATTVIPSIVESKSTGDVVRVWVAGCATGEEAYSVAMLMLEEIGRQRKACPLQIFASDIDSEALDRARVGSYPISIEADVSHERIKRFFNLLDGNLHYQVTKVLRETVVFAQQNLISDPPFSQLDLVCCRNVLIYLKPELQQKIIALFHFSLRQAGYLMLGTAETIGRQHELFETIDKQGRIYRGIGSKHRDRESLPSFHLEPRHELGLSTQILPAKRPADLVRQKLLEMISVRAVLIDRQWHIHYISGNVNAYLTHQEGVPSDDFLKKIDPSLRSQVRATVNQAYANNAQASAVVRTRRDSSIHEVRIEVRLVPCDGRQDDFALVIFDEPEQSKSEQSKSEQTKPEQTKPEQTKPEQSKPEQTKPETASLANVRLNIDETCSNTPSETVDLSKFDLDVDERSLVEQLENELSATKDDLQATIEQFEVANEEFKASHEEVMSINEELQSTNEELETSKEELQSLNEELSTVNQQLSGKVHELEVKHSDLENLIAATEVATVCLGTDLTIRWFTPATRDLIRIQAADVGRPLEDLQNDFVSDNLVEQAEQVLQRLVSTENEVDCTDERTFLRRIMPYRTDEHRIGGVLITLVDITSRRKREEELRASEGKLREMNQTLEQTVTQRTELLSILQHVTQVANEARSVDEAMRATMDRLAHFNSWQVGHVWRLARQDQGEPLEMISSKLWHVHDDFKHEHERLAEFQRLTQQMSIHSDDGMIGRVMRSGRPEQVGEFAKELDTPRSKVDGLSLHGTIAFPISVDGQVVAIMEFFSSETTDPEPGFLNLMPIVGIQLGHVIQRKRLEQVVKNIADEEGRRIGRELHDGIAQQLTGGALIAESLRRSLPAEMTAQVASSDHLIEILQDTHDDVSRLSQGLMPDAVRADDLLPSLNGLVEEAQDRFKAHVTLKADAFNEGFVENDATAQTIHQIAREALHNAIKHANSDEIVLEVSTGDQFRLIVSDRGDGFELLETKPHNNGLRIMRYRAEAIGGELTIQSAEDEGTTILLTIPEPMCR